MNTQPTPSASDKPTYEEVTQALLVLYKVDWHICHESECRQEQRNAKEQARKVLERAKLPSQGSLSMANLPNKPTEEQIRCFVRDQVSAIVEAMDLDQILGTETFERFCGNDSLMVFVEKCRNRIAEQIRGIQLHGVPF